MTKAIDPKIYIGLQITVKNPQPLNLRELQSKAAKFLGARDDSKYTPEDWLASGLWKGTVDTCYISNNGLALLSVFKELELSGKDFLADLKAQIGLAFIKAKGTVTDVEISQLTSMCPMSARRGLIACVLRGRATKVSKNDNRYTLRPKDSAFLLLEDVVSAAELQHTRKIARAILSRPVSASELASHPTHKMSPQQLSQQKGLGILKSTARDIITFTDSPMVQDWLRRENLIPGLEAVEESLDFTLSPETADLLKQARTLANGNHKVLDKAIDKHVNDYLTRKLAEAKKAEEAARNQYWSSQI